MRYFLLLENSEIQEVFAKDILSCPLDHSGFKVLAVATSEKAIKETKKILMSKDEYQITGRIDDHTEGISFPVSQESPVSKPGR
jgi:hypothetical protein